MTREPEAAREPPSRRFRLGRPRPVTARLLPVTVRRPPLAPLLVPMAVLFLLSGCRGDTDRAGPDSESAPSSPAASLPVLTVTDTDLLLRTDVGDSVRVTLADTASGTRFVSAALRPGSTGERATVVAIVSAQDGHDLRWLTTDGGELGPLQPFPPRFGRMFSLPPRREAEPSVSWTPDGESIVLLGWTPQGAATLLTVGWDDGPGTGEPATDNASFVLEPAPAGSRMAEWREMGPATWHAELEDVDGERWILLVERQADGAVALPRSSPGNPCRAPCDPR